MLCDVRNCPVTIDEMVPTAERTTAVSRCRIWKEMTGRVVITAFAAMATLGFVGGCRERPRESAPAAPPAESPVAVTEKWRAKHEADYRREWVVIAGLHQLKPGANTAGSASTNAIVLPASVPPQLGRFIRSDKTVSFEPASGVTVTLNGQPVTKAITLRDDREPKADELAVGDVRLVVHVSGETRSLRVRDPNGPIAKGFLGFTWFPIDLQYRVIGKFVRDPQPQSIKVLNTFGEVDEYKSEGVITFTLLGQTLQIRPFTTRPKRFYIVFKDASSGQETYEAARFLYTDLQDDGSVVLDFNQAYNPPCAFNQYTTCPLPLRENRLPIKVLAGEKAYASH
jgi:uncharacterized protein